MKQYKHKLTGNIATAIYHGETYKGIQYYRLDNDKYSSLPESLLKGNDWEEIIEYPVGTLVNDGGWIFEKVDANKWKRTEETHIILPFTDNEIRMRIKAGFTKIIEQKKSEYTILSFKQDSGITDLWTEFEHGWARNINGKAVTQPYSLRSILENALYSIHSVRRESDGEVFTVGEAIRHNSLDAWGSGKIKEILLTDALYLYTLTEFNGGCGIPISMAKKVKPKEWEITAIKNKINDKVHTVNLLDKVARDYEIYSVRRTSDGVEFKIGDKFKITGVNRGAFHDGNTIRTLNSFSKGGYVHFDECIATSIDATIADWVKVEKLFTTEDGLDIHEGDSVWYVNEGWRAVYRSAPNNYKSWACKFFSTNEAADAYILMNKPCLSVNDILRYEDATADGNIFINRGTIKKLAKSKINGN